MAPPEERDEHGDNEARLCPVMEEETEEMEKPSSSEQNDAAFGGDQTEGASTTSRKKRKDWRAFPDENGSGTKRILRSDVVKLRAEAEAAMRRASERDGHQAPRGENGSDITKGDGSDKMQCGGDVEAGGMTVLPHNTNKRSRDAEVLSSEVAEFHACTTELTMDACCNEDEGREGTDGSANHNTGDTVRITGNDVEDSNADATVIVEETGKESSAGREKEGEKLSSGMHGDNISSPVLERSTIEAGACSEKVKNKAAAGKEDDFSNCTGKSNQTGEVHGVEHDDIRSNGKGMEEHINGTERVEEHCHADATNRETEGPCNEDVRSIEEAKATQVDAIKEKKCDDDTEVETGSVAGVPEQKEELGALEKESKEVAASGHALTRKRYTAGKTSATKRTKIDEEVQFEKRVTRSAAAKQREDAENLGKITIANETISDRDNGFHIKGQRSGADHGDPAEAIVYEEMEIEKNEDLKLKDFIRSRNSSTVKKKATEDAISAVDQNVCSSDITERDDTVLVESEGVKSENRSALRKTGKRQGGKLGARGKRLMESKLQNRGRSSSVASPSRKKSKTKSFETELELTEECAGKMLTGKTCASGKKSVQMKKQVSSSKIDVTGSVTRYGRRTRKPPEIEPDALDSETDSDASHKKILAGCSRGGVSVVMTKQKNTSGSKEVSIVRRGRPKGKSSGCTVGDGTISKQSSVASKTDCLGKSRSCKFESKSLSWQAERARARSSNSKIVVDKASNVRTSPNQQRNSGDAGGGLAEQKRKISDQIKNMLVNAGWKIDLRPRNGRNYMDSVYVSPTGKGSYWSITKAYYVFLSEQNDKKKSKSPSKPYKGSPRKGTAPAFRPIPDELLSMLKKTMVNKRRSKEVLEKLKKKKGGRIKKFKGYKGYTANTKGKAKEKNNKSSSSKKLHSGRPRKKQGGCTLLVRGANQEAANSSDTYVPYEWKRTVFSWLIDLDVLSVHTKVKYMDQSHTKVLLEGLVTRDGINCNCCSNALSVFEFGLHAGSEACQPYRNIVVEELEIDLLHCLINTWDKQADTERQAFFPINTDGDDPNDDTCGICGDGGDLICCDGCPSTFHMNCLGLQALPSDDWRCANCSCKFCQEHSSPDVQEIAEDDSSLLACSQCEEKFHQKCAPEMNCLSHVSTHLCYSFCQQSCRELSERLQKLLAVKNDLKDGFSWRLVQRVHDDLPETVFGLDQKAECNAKIAVALAIMEECFLPIIDQRSRIDLIHNVVYNCGSNFVRLDFRGFYTFILERGDEIISVASIRIHGTKLAEMPFIGTRNMYRRQGMCRRLLDGIESILCSLKVEKLVIPAISELIDTWTNSFGFRPLESSHKEDVRSISMLVFPGTGLLQKPLLGKTSTRNCQGAQEDDDVVAESKSSKTSDAANETSICSIADTEAQDFTNCRGDDRDAVHCSGDLSNEPIGASCESKFEASEVKSSYINAGEDLVHFQRVCKDKKVISSKSCESSEHESNSGSMDAMQITEAEHVNDSDEREMVIDGREEKKTTREHMLGAPVDIVANIQESGAEDAANCHLVESSSTRQQDETPLTLSDDKKSGLGGSGQTCLTRSGLGQCMNETSPVCDSACVAAGGRE